MNYQELLTDELVSVLDKYSLPGQHYGSDLLNIIKNADSKEIIIPVLGVQGAGKSTLINAILGDDIMPSEADETTCAPVEVKFGTDEKAEVFFLDNSSPITIHTKKELGVFVDNNANPGNKKKVSRIVLYRKNELLKGGLTLVDLPGVASLTRENEETTRKYILNLCTALFVIQGSLTKTAAMFIKSVWVQFPTAFFVQNRWSGESDQEIEEIVPWNELQVKKIAEQLNNPFDGQITVVNAYEGIVGALNNDLSQTSSSNIKEVCNKLYDFSNNWTSTFNKAVADKFRDCVTFAKERIIKRISEAKKSEDERIEEIAQMENDFNKETERINKLLSEIEEELSSLQDETIAKISQKTKEYGGKLRAEMHRIIDKGVTDGIQLTQAFVHTQEDLAELLFEEVFELITELKLNLEEKIERFGQIIEIDESFGPEYVSFTKEKSFKYEKGLVAVIDIAACYGGGIAIPAASTAVTAAIAAGIKAGTISAEIGAFAGPIGIAAGVLTGAAIAVATYFITSKTQNAIVDNRGKATKKEIDKSIAESESNVKQHLLDKIEEFFNKAQKAILEIKRLRKMQHDSLLKDLELSRDQSLLPGLEADLEFILIVLKKLEEL